MTSKVVISFAARSPRSKEGLAVLLAAGGAKFGDSSGEVDPGKVVEKATKVAAFTGKALATLDVLAPGGSPYDRQDAVVWRAFGGERTELAEARRRHPGPGEEVGRRHRLSPGTGL